MKKFILSIIIFVFLFLPASSSVYAVPEETTSSTKPSSGYDPKCWNTHMIDQMAVCSRAFLDCVKPCVKMDLKANTACLKTCSKVHTACLDSASAAYKVCIEAEKQAKKQQEIQLESKTTQAPSKKPAIQNKSSETNPFNIFGINPYETWLNIQSLAYLNSSLLIEDIEMYALDVTGHKVAFERMKEDRAIREGQDDTSRPDEQNQTNTSEVSSQELKDLGAYASVDELLNRTPQITEEIIKKAQEEWEKMTDSTKRSISPYSIDILNGQAQIKYPNENEWRDVKAGDKIPPGSTIFTGMDTTTVLTIESKGVVQIAPFSEVTINESGLEQATLNKTIFTDIELRTGEIELDVKGPTFGPSFQVFTTNAVAGVRGTHFWVSYNKDKNLSTVGVYEGAVEVKSRESDKSIMVSPNGDKPGIVVVAQKLSIIKLALAGLVLAAIVGGVVLILKRKFAAKGSNKKRK